MPVSQSRLLFLSLVTGSLLANTSWADSVIVNTIKDENNINNSSCSIREAIYYLNEKNAKKAIIDEEIAVISGTSTVLTDALVTAKLDLATEKNKASPDPTVIATLEQKIADLTAKIDNSINGLNKKLIVAKDGLAKEQSKSSPDAAVIANYESEITNLNTKITQKQTEKTAKEEELSTYRSTGLFGCSTNSATAADNILLTQNIGNYLVSSPITINLNVNFTLNKVDDDTTTDETGLSGLEGNSSNPNYSRTVIKAENNNRLFTIDDGINNDHDNNSSTPDRRVQVSFVDIDFLGCNNNCATDGGIFLNKESLAISNGVISNGFAANLGGAIYNADRAILTLNSIVLKNNQAQDGAAIYSVNISFSLVSSLVTENQTNQGVISVEKNIITMLTSVLRPYIENVTISGNTGTALAVKEGLVINSSTIVNNTIGVNLANGLPTIYNSIIAGNSTADCQSFGTIPADSKVYFANNLSVTNKGCPVASSNNHNIFISNTGNETLLASTDSNGKCASPPAVGLLCPLADFGGYTRTHKPRLLADYTALSDSVLINKGYSKLLVGSLGVPCSSMDQRAKPRENNEDACDIGAVEMITGLNTYTQGDDIVFGQVKRFSPLDNLGDAELLPAAYCASVLGAGVYLNGCIRLMDLPKHGSIDFDQSNGDMLYRTLNPEFHGFDKFSYGVVTTLSRFHDAINDRVLKTNVKVVSEPPGSLESKHLDNGSSSLFSLLFLGLIAIWRRIR